MSCFESVTACKHIVLSPKYLGSVKDGIINQLEAEKNVFSDLLEGAVIAYDNIKLKSSSGAIVNEESHVHFDIQADFIVFRPFVGAKLKGKVNRIFKQHVVCLVHDSFNAPIHKPKGQTGGWEGSNLTVGEIITFTVTNVYINNGVLSMRGELLGSRRGSKKKQKRRNMTSENTGETATIDLTENTGESGDVNHDSAYHTNSSIDEECKSPGKKKKKKKLKKTSTEEEKDTGANVSNLDTNSQGGLSVLSNADSDVQKAEEGAGMNEVGSSRVKKAKKRKHEDSSLDAEEGSLSHIHSENTEGENSVVTESKKKHKKHKKHKKDSIDMETENDFTSIKSWSAEQNGSDRLHNSVIGDSSGDISKPKKKKKDKRQSSEDVDGRVLDTVDKHHKKLKQKRKHNAIEDD
ncbi:hypothetical protein FSP39_015146 [Pinctada imbricata]|uniref:DNA-directed RNA polymerase I subunit RPA43 n=1 Tax=Pinctada imbricata TaxID=66713 RepID=A0AA88YDU7_PINIB|nr:hypothetical protein FSP39_015146 [Pinctada imbricata]